MEDPKLICWGDKIPENIDEGKIKPTEWLAKHAKGKSIRHAGRFELFFHYPKQTPLNPEDYRYCQIDIYEPHGWFWVEEKQVYIVYGHEEIQVIRPDGAIIAKQHTR